MQKNVDTLHRVVTEARARRQRGETPGADRWRADVQPRAAVRARTIPALERERDLLRARLAEVRRLPRSLNLFFFLSSKLASRAPDGYLRRWRGKIRSCTAKYRRMWRCRAKRTPRRPRSLHFLTRCERSCFSSVVSWGFGLGWADWLAGWLTACFDRSTRDGRSFPWKTCRPGHC